MFVQTKSDVDVYTNEIYSFVVKSKGREYIEFLQNALNRKGKIEEIFKIVIADICDYFCEHVNSCESTYENLSEKKISELEYINDEIFIEYALDKFFKKSASNTDNINLMFLIKNILISLYDVNKNIVYAVKYSKNKDADQRIKCIIAKYTDAQIKVTANVLNKIGVKSEKSMSICRFAEIYERYVENRINEFENGIDVKDKEIELKEKDLLVYFYLKSFSKKFVDIKIEEIAKDCKISIATVSRAIKKLREAKKIRVYKKNNKNIYEIIEIKREQHTQQITEISQEQKIYNKRKFTSRNIKIYVSESDFIRREKGEKLDANTRYKLYLYRKKYEEELANLRLSRLAKDHALFFFINTENLVVNQTISIEKVISIIEYADSNIEIKNPIGWLISRFSIGRGRFYFLLRKPNPSSEDEKQPEKHHQKQKQEKSYTTKRYDTYIREDLAYFIRKYSVPVCSITDYVRKMNLHGDISVAIEQYLVSWLWKHHITTEKKRELIQHAKKEIKKFVVPPKPSELESYIKSIIRNKIREEYLTLSTEDKIRLFSRKQHSNLQQHYDTS